jgi:hypothetical protein
MKKWLTWIAILLLVINITAIITLLYTRKQEKEAGEKTFAADSSVSVPSMEYSGRWFRDELGLTREQMREFSQFNPTFRQEVRKINIELFAKRGLMLDEMTAENSDTSRLNMLSDSIGMLHSELKKATYSYFLEFKRICTADQEEKLIQIFRRMFEGEIPAGPGRGMQGGGRSGMRRGGYPNH